MRRGIRWRAALTALVTVLLWSPAGSSLAQAPEGTSPESTAAAQTAARPSESGAVSQPTDSTPPTEGGGSDLKVEPKDPPPKDPPVEPKDPPAEPKDPPAEPKDPPTNDKPQDKPKPLPEPKPKTTGGSEESKKPSPPPAQPRERPTPPPLAPVKPAPAKAPKPPARKNAKSPARKGGASGQAITQVGAAGPTPARAEVARTTVSGDSFVSQDIPRRGRAQVGPFATVRIAGRLTRRGARVRLLTVTAPRSSTVTVRCRGRGCGPRSQSRLVAAAAEQTPATKPLRFSNVQRNLHAGTVIEVSVTQPDAVGKFTRFVIRAGKPPLRRDLCLAPGSTRPTSCA